jgi:hypothetical protein
VGPATVTLTDIPLEVITGLVGLAVGAAGAWTNMRAAHERRQPIVIAHEDKSRTFDRSTPAWVAEAHLVNESGPAAFNLRFGVEYSGVRFPYRLMPADPDEGNIQPVIRPEQRLPDSASFPILISSEDLWGTAATRGPLDSTAVYWCRYENARQQTWETRNPADRSAGLKIKRVRRVKAAERREKEARDRMRDSGWETKVLGEFVNRQD